MKPIDEARFQTALNRVRRRMAENARAPLDANQLKQAAKVPGDYAERIVVKDDTRVWRRRLIRAAIFGCIDRTLWARSRRRRLSPVRKTAWIAILKNGAQVPVSRTGYLRLREAMER